MREWHDYDHNKTQSFLEDVLLFKILMIFSSNGHDDHRQEDKRAQSQNTDDNSKQNLKIFI